MCLAVIALQAHPRYAVVLAANRDEFHARGAEPAHWWSDPPILAGRDATAGGTWLGVNRAGRYAFVTNVREPGRHDPAAPTRGTLVPDVLGAHAPLAHALADALDEGRAMNGFNLLAGDARRASWASNRSPATCSIEDGVHALSNAALDTPWPKLVRVRAAVAQWALDAQATDARGADAARSEAADARGADATARERVDVETLFAILADRQCPADAELPRTGVALEWERRLSSPFICSPSYGTRCSTVVLIGRDGRVRFVERSFDPAGARCGEVDEAFTTSSAAGVDTVTAEPAPSPDAQSRPPRTRRRAAGSRGARRTASPAPGR